MRAVRFCARCVRAVMLLAISLLLLGLLAVVGLYAYQVKNGVPDWMVKRLQAPLNEFGYEVEAEELKVVSFRGIKARSMEIGRPGAEPLFSGDVIFQSPVQAWMRQKIQPADLQVDGGRLFLDLEQLAPGSELPPIEVEPVELGGVYRDDTIFVHWLSGEFEGIELNISGSFERPDGEDAEERQDAEAEAEDAEFTEITEAGGRSVDSGIAHLLEQLQPYRDVLQRARFSVPPRLDLHVVMGEGHREVQASLRFDGPAEIEGRRIESLHCKMRMQGDLIELEEFSLKLPASSCELTGSYWIGVDEAIVDVAMQGDFDELKSCLPKPWQRKFDQVGVTPSGHVKLNAELGPFTPSGTVDLWRGKAWIDRVTYRTGQWDRVAVDLAQTGQVVTVRATIHDGAAVVAGQVNVSNLEGQGTISLNTDAAQIRRWLPSEVAKLADQGIDAQGAVSGDIRLGPGPVKEWLQRASGSMSVNAIGMREKLFTDVGLRGQRKSGEIAFDVKANNGLFHINGRIDEGADRVEAQLDVDGTMNELRSFLPARALEELARQEVQFVGNLVGSVKIGPCRRVDASNVWTAQGSAQQVNVRGFQLADLQVQGESSLGGMKAGVEAENGALTLEVTRDSRGVHQVTGGLRFPFQRLAPLVPAKVVADLAKQEIAIGGDVLARFAAGPEPLDRLLDRFKLNATVNKVRVRKSMFDRVDCEVIRNGGPYEILARGVAADIDLQPDSRADSRVDLRAKATFDPVHKTLAADVSSDSPGLFLLGMMPVDWKLKIAEKRARFEGRVNSRMRTGPLPVAQALKAWQGKIEAEELNVNGARVPRVVMDVKMEPDGALLFENIDMTVGRGQKTGRAFGWMKLDLPRTWIHAKVNAQAYPEELTAFFPNLADVMATTEPKGEAPIFNIEYTRDWSVKHSSVAKGVVGGKNLLFKGVHFDELEFAVHFRDLKTRIDLQRAIRPEGDASGWVEYDDRARNWTVDVESTIYAPALAKLGGPGVEKVFSVFDFNGDTHASMQGVIDLDKVATQLNGTFYGEQIDLDWIHLDDCQFTWGITNDRVRLRNFGGHYLHGELGAVIDFDHIHDDRRQMTMDVEVKAGELSRFTYLRAGKKADLNGKFDTTARLQCGLGGDWKKTIRGTGAVRVYDGQLLRFPIFGGLSKLISKVIPGVGYATQTELTADLEFGDEKVYFNDAKLEGGALLIAGDGWLGFDRRVQLDGRVKPPDANFLTDIIGVVTSPLSYLVDFRTKGTLDEHETTLRRVPKEIQELFR